MEERVLVNSCKQIKVKIGNFAFLLLFFSFFHHVETKAIEPKGKVICSPAAALYFRLSIINTARIICASFSSGIYFWFGNARHKYPKRLMDPTFDFLRSRTGALTKTKDHYIISDSLCVLCFAYSKLIARSRIFSLRFHSFLRARTHFVSHLHTTNSRHKTTTSNTIANI